MYYYKRNLGDYAKKAGRLSMLQHGSYTLLIDACYDREEFPTLEQAIEWTWASSTEEVEAVTFVLRKFFTLKDGVYVQKRIQEEIAEYHAKSEVNQRIAIERETKRKEKSTVRAPAVHEPPPNQEPLTINHKPLTINQEPITINHKPDSKTKQSQNPSAAIAPSGKKTTVKSEPELQAASKRTWQAYGKAYFDRYGTEPVRNAKVSSMVKLFVQRIGMEEAPMVAAYYVTHNEQFYVKKLHPIDLLLKDAEGLRTQWANGRAMTGTRARQIDQGQANFNVVAEAMEILERKKHANPA